MEGVFPADVARCKKLMKKIKEKAIIAMVYNGDIGDGSILSKTFPTYPWNIPRTMNKDFMKEFLSFGGLGMPGVCSRGVLGFS